MKTVYKYPFSIQDCNLLKLPIGAIPLHVGVDPSGTPCLWAEVLPSNDLKECELWVVGTGHPIPTGLNYVGSFVQSPFVWHIYLSIP